MGVTFSRLTIMFEEPFWIGIYEREYSGKYEVAKVTFGKEPKDTEVYEFFLHNWKDLRFSPSINAELPPEKATNPKRLQRQIKKQLENTGVGTKAQQALKLQHEEGKLKRKVISKEQREAEKERDFLMHKEKRKEKHRGH